MTFAIWLGFLLLLSFSSLSCGYEFLLEKKSQPLCLVDLSSSDKLLGYYERVAQNLAVVSAQEMELTVYSPTHTKAYSERMKLGTRYYFQVPKMESSEGGTFYTVCCEILSNSRGISSNERVVFKVYDDGDHFTELSARNKVKNRQIIDGEAVYSYVDAGGQMKSALVNKANLLDSEKKVLQVQYRLDDIVSEAEKGIALEKYLFFMSENTFTRIWFSFILLAAAIAGVVRLQYAYLTRRVKHKL